MHKRDKLLTIPVDRYRFLSITTAIDIYGQHPW